MKNGEQINKDIKSLAENLEIPENYIYIAIKKAVMDYNYSNASGVMEYNNIPKGQYIDINKR